MAIVSFLESVQTKKILPVFSSSLEKYLKDLSSPHSKIREEFLALSSGEKNERILSDGLKAIEQCYLTTTPDKAIIESHKQYIDFQLLIEGQELMETTNVSKLEIKYPLNSERDLIVYQDSEELQLLKMKAWDYAIFFPEDAHRSTMIFHKEMLVRKVVVKIPVI